MTEKTIVITKLQPAKEPGALKAYVDIEIPSFKGWFVRGIKIFQTERASWVQMPSDKFKNDEGKDCYNAWTGYRDRESKDKLGKAIIAEYRSMLNSAPQKVEPIQQPPPTQEFNLF